MDYYTLPITGRAERARVKVEYKDVLNTFVLLVDTQLTLLEYTSTDLAIQIE